MRLKLAPMLYIAVGLSAIAALVFMFQKPGGGASRVETAQLGSLLEGSMKKLVFHPGPKPVSQASFVSEGGGTATLADYRGKIALVNFWATWCAPCRKEMPLLARLQTEFGGPDFEVVTIATGRNPPPAMKTFFDEIGVDNLPLNRDPDMSLAREMGVIGLPATLILDREGREIARMLGDAEWDSDSARALLRKLIADTATATAGS